MTLTLTDLSVLVGMYALLAAGLYALLRAEFRSEFNEKFTSLRSEFNEKFTSLRSEFNEKFERLSERIQRIEKELEYLRGRLDTIASFIEQLIGPASRK